jgi:hypothetical protein
MCKTLFFFCLLNYNVTTFRKLNSASVFRKKGKKAENLSAEPLVELVLDFVEASSTSGHN